MSPAESADDERWMDAALAFGRRALGTTAPNPAVGAILVKDGRVIGAGATGPGGRPHGETIALLEAGSQARGATLYVTLEPCSHHGVTPPCAEAVAAAGVARVVCALEDPDVRVRGRGIALLRAAGVEVGVGLRGETARRDHLGHILRVTMGRPMLTLKIARTSDGYAAGDEHDTRLTITGAVANSRVQTLRATHDAIMVGIGTAIDDDPLLTVRLPGLEQKPLRIILDSRLRLPLSSRLVASANEIPTLAIAALDASVEREDELRTRGIEVVRVAIGADSRLDLAAALQHLGARGLTRVLSEGGPCVGSRLIGAGLADVVILFTATKPLGRPGQAALAPDAVTALDDRARYSETEVAVYGLDEMRRWEQTDAAGDHSRPAHGGE